MLSLSSVHGIIDRRLLVNFVADPSVVQKLLPSPFRPQVFKGKAVVGICLIRFAGLRSKFMPEFLGFNTENAAHRIAVEWDGDDGLQTGVYVVRRDTSSRLIALLGGRLFSGVHFHAKFNSVDAPPRYAVEYASDDQSTRVKVDGRVVSEIPKTSLFENLETSSNFFKMGSVGYSPGFHDTQEGLKLVVDEWRADAFEIDHVASSFFSDERYFPKGSVQYDHSLIMRNISHRWDSVKTLK